MWHKTKRSGFGKTRNQKTNRVFEGLVITISRCDFLKTSVTLMRQSSHCSGTPNTTHQPRRGTVCLSSRHHFSSQSLDRCRAEPIYSLEILTWTCPEMTRGEVAYFSVIRKGVRASLAKWISPRVANMGHFCTKFSGFNFYPPRYPTLGLHHRQPRVQWSKFLTSTVMWKARRRNWTRGKSCLVGFLHQPPWGKKKKKWGKCLMSVSLKQLWGLAANTQCEERDLLRRGPFNLFLQRLDSIFVPAKPPRGSYWRADAPRREHPALSGSPVTRTGRGGGCCGSRGLLRVPGSPDPVENY